ncbi:helix-turn-helix domain-containing protein [Aquimarina hainanensis]|uniref:Helix-turn-helix domain-containing protein n=1 Tax=Aquimarina hainanensis TaxID=1578017 RepID=A0ABW5NBI5_9FLAO
MLFLLIFVVFSGFRYVYSQENKNTYSFVSSEAVVVEKNNFSLDSLAFLKNMALYYADKQRDVLASKYIDKYIKRSLDVSFLSEKKILKIKNSEKFIELEKLYSKRIDIWSLLCFYVGFVGMFIAIVLNFRKKTDKVANLLISIIVLQHSLSIIYIGFVLTNYNFESPHSLYVTTWFSMLYGPILYLYFKRITIGYTLQKKDMLHGIPTIMCILFLLPVYGLSPEEKLRILITRDLPYSGVLSLLKWASITIYGVMAIQLFITFEKRIGENVNKICKWKRYIIFFWGTYIVSYTIYAVLLETDLVTEVLYYAQIVSITLLVMYIGYMTYIYPDIFGKVKLEEVSGTGIKQKEKSKSIKKYKNSGLTKNYSIELKNRLLFLLNEDKVFKRNDLTLQKLSEMLGTSRHNTSQIINEHFRLNFFELINSYRIKEAKEILRNEGYKNINIIDVAYEVGFNNKVTFNKSFKKYNKITPSEYIKSSAIKRVADMNSLS